MYVMVAFIFVWSNVFARNSVALLAVGIGE